MDKPVNRKVFIAEDVMPFITLPNFNSENIVITKSILEAVTNNISAEKESPLFAVLFLTVNEFDNVFYFFKKYKYSDLIYKVILFDTKGTLNTFSDEKVEYIMELRTSHLSVVEFQFTIRKAFHQVEDYYTFKTRKDEFLLQLLDTKQDQEDLINIGKSLQLEKDPDKLLRLILFLSKKITGADGGSIYLIEEIEDGKKQLRFRYSHTFSKEIPLEEFVIPFDKNSIAGYVATTGTVMNLPDVYNLPPNSPVSFNTSIDRIHGYQSRTMLVVPMKNHIDEVIGVIQLINSKEDLQGSSKISGNEAFEIRLESHEDFNTKVVPFEERYNSLMEAVASQAAIAIENNRMIKQIQNQFEEFVKASVAAIESRDEATSGHSFRVAEICKLMARAINSEKKGHYKDMQFSDVEIKELEYSALLHDFGKVYIDLAIFMKGKKLFPKDYENVMLKINYLYRIIELNFAEWEKEKLNKALDPENNSVTVEAFETEREKKLSSIKQIRDSIAQLNEPTVTDKDPKEVLASIMSIIDQTCCRDMDGNAIEIIDSYERENLEIKRGSLNDVERKEIESHVIHTYNFVSKIPWPPEFKNIPEFALKHHEKLDGTGYPHNLKGKDQIPVQARMMAIADIYDALTASDRPYKKAIPPERAISILEEEASRNKIDPDLFEIFVRYKIYEKISKDDYRKME